MCSNTLERYVKTSNTLRNFWWLCLVLPVGLAWANSVVAQSLTRPDPADDRPAMQVDPTPAAVNTTPERPEPGGRRGPMSSASDETQMLIGDLTERPRSGWLSDVLVGDPTFDEVEPAMCKSPEGVLFIAVEQYGATYDGWVRVYRSNDGGQTWAWLISFRTGTESRNPSITYAKRASGEKWVFLAYAATMSDSSKQIIVIRFDPSNPSGTWTPVTAATGITGTPDIYPRICTDTLIYDVFYVYVTYSVNAVDYYAVKFTRSLDYGLTYSAPQDITGGAESSSFMSRPDIAYGSAGLFVAFEKAGWTGSAWKTQVWVTRSTNYGGTWSAPIQLTTAEDGAWHPSVAAAVGVSTVMIAFTQPFASQTDIFCAYSTNGGTSFSSGGPLPRTFDDEKTVALSVSDSGGLYHAAFWRAYNIEYTSTDATSPLPWAPVALVNEANWASSAYSRPAICINPTKPKAQEACVAWTDYRGSFYDVYFDAEFRDGACCFPDESCSVMNQTDCIGAGGVWQGSGIACESGLCLIDPCDTDSMAPTAHLTLGDFQCVPAAGITPIVATTTDPEGNLDTWMLEERGMGASPWNLVAMGHTPIVNGVLLNWVPAAPGYRMLRLTALDACGHTSTDVHLMYADQGPQTVLNYPAAGAILGGSAVCIDGLVSHGVCALSWLLEYRPGAGAWTTLANGTSAVLNLPLGQWNTTALADGSYSIRLSATSIGGANSRTVGVTVDNTPPVAVISSPVSCTFVDGVVPIVGTANDANLLGWQLYYAGGDAHGWILINSGTTPVINGVLANWNAAALAPCAYALRLVVTDKSVLDCNSALHNQREYVTLVAVGVGGDCDMNGDGFANGMDVQPFVNCLLTGP
ncbi:MAG: exo-alpha-sialidase [Phycisphaerae bacterium]|nr:exo-alpha-sialidase [Phycisphaerae bacterium]